MVTTASTPPDNNDNDNNNNEGDGDGEGEEKLEKKTNTIESSTDDTIAKSTDEQISPSKSIPVPVPVPVPTPIPILPLDEAEILEKVLQLNNRRQLLKEQMNKQCDYTKNLCDNLDSHVNNLGTVCVI